jgi:predicted nuclease of predicted toxin-antitoxin system
MKVLLDENLPVKLKYKFSPAIQVYTVYDMKWNSLKNGELLGSLGENNFDALITSDKNIIHQHKLSKYPFRFIIIKATDNQLETLLPVVPMIEEELLLPGEQVIYINTR